MAKKGLSYSAFSHYHYENGITTYTDGRKLSPAAAFNAGIAAADVIDYGDDHDVEVYDAVTGGNLTVELNNDNDEMYTYLLGAKMDGESVVSNTRDEHPYLGAAVIGPSGDKYVAKVYKKCRFSEPADDNATRTDTITFGHLSIPGRILIPEDGEWRIRQSFETLEAAIAWVVELFDIR